MHKLALSAHPAQYFKNDSIFKKGDLADSMFFVISGVAQVYDEDTKTIYAEFDVGTFFGEIGILFAMPRSSSVRCKSSQLLVFSISKSNMDEILTFYPEIAQKIQIEAQIRLQYIQDRTNHLQMKTEIDVVRQYFKEAFCI